MALSQEEKTKMAEHLRGTNVAQEHITEDYRKNLGLAEREERDISTEEGPSRCYIFTAKNRVPKCPVHINIHGGGFVRPHLLRDEIYSAKIAHAIEGIVVDVDYRLAPEFPFPAAFNECYGICKWVFAQAGVWDADEKRISLGGHSAGGNLTAAVALKANKTGEFRLCLQVIDYAAIDMLTDPADKPEADINMIPAERGRMFFRAYTGGDMETAHSPYCSPSEASDEMLKGLPEALVISAGRDNFRFEDEAYAARLIAGGVTVTAKRFLNSDHGFITHCTGEWEEAQQLIIRAIRQASLD
ncbi:alpha/beta hydrolase [Treponema sp. OttesenSCG-928-L16]|nr:alpha/beta hydrolase [Treponema sp. OttesenSCG-928-L16]